MPASGSSQLWLLERLNCLALSVGVALSAYGLYVELRHEQNNSYEAMCDVSETISCTKAMSSSFATGFGIVESLLGKEHFLNQVLVLIREEYTVV